MWQYRPKADQTIQPCVLHNMTPLTKFWILITGNVSTCAVKPIYIQSNLYIYIVKATLRKLKMWPLWAVAFYTQVKIIVKPAHAVTCIKRSPFSCPVIENFIWIEPLLRGHFYLSQGWLLNTGLTVYIH